jgi:DNA-binding transcriptional LysR family regulator
MCDDGDAVRRLALAGAGIAYKSRLDVAEDLRRGGLVPLCEAWRGESAPLYLACADRSQLRPVVRLLREFLVERFATRA